MKGHDKLKEFLDSELSDYSFEIGEIKVNDGYTQTEEDEYYEVEIKWTYNDEKSKTLYFHYDRKEDKLEVELSEDCYEEITTYDWRVKHFWMALLEW